MFDFRCTKSKLLMEPWEKKIQLKLEMSVLDGTQPPIYTTFFLFPSRLQRMENQKSHFSNALTFGVVDANQVLPN